MRYLWGVIGLSLILGLGSGCERTVTQPQTNGQLIRLQGASNTQDLGGIRTKNGAHLRARRLIRSNQLAHLTKADVQILIRTYQLTAIADLRSHDEIQQTPDIEVPNVTYYQDSVVADHLPHQSTHQLYRGLVTTPIARQGYRALFKQLLSPHHGAILYHCTYGKDRTGVATVLILAALGVSKKVIQQNYLQSNHNLAQGSRLTFKDPANPNQPFKRVQTANLTLIYHQIDQHYGSLTKFLRVLGVTPANQRQLRADYLTKN